MNSSIRTIDFTIIRRDIQQLFGGFLALASTAALVMTLQALVSGAIAKIIAIVAGIALQGCLYLFSNDNNHRIKGFSVILLALSVCITTWYMERTWQTQQTGLRSISQQQADNSWQAGQYRQQIEDLNRQINMLLTSADRDIKATYRTRGLDTNDEVTRLTAKRDNLLTQLGSLTASAVSISNPSLFEQNNRIRLSLFFAIALLIDIAAIIALGSSNERKPRLTAKNRSSTQESNNAEHHWPLSHVEKTMPTNAPDQYAAQPEEQPLEIILNKIRTGDYGEICAG